MTQKNKNYLTIKEFSLRTRNIFVAIVFSLSVFISLSPANVLAAQITSRKVTLSNSGGAATGVTYTFNFTVPTATVLKSFQAQICTTASGACTTPVGWSGAASDLAAQPTNYGDASGWTDASTASALRMTKTTNSAAPTGSQTVAFNGTVNPTANNTTFFARITTYSDDAYTTAVDSGVVAASTSQQITLTGTIDETLTFCTGTSITGTNCGTVAGSSVNFGSFSSTSTSSGTSVMAASTNADGGYSITVNGTTLTSGGDTISALAAQTASSIGSEQFGLNLKDNTTPNVGAEVSGTGSGAATANYGTADQFRFVTGDSISSAAGNTDANTFTASYIVNVGGSTEPGTYTAIMTYICTATF
ncbi:MAG TPA: hypothetical protein PKB09_01070 [Candidatus Saccharibacteria bacterium]|nr:hypothetical protein [Candidatus Saccharibacteria bacterium]